MTLFKHNQNYQDPFAGLDALLDHFSRGFRDTFSDVVSGRQIPVNLYATDDSYEVRAEMPGVRKEDVSIELENAVLSIRAKRSLENEQGGGEITMARDITVGDDVAADKVKARMENGVLSIQLPKREARKPKAIKVA